MEDCKSASSCSRPACKWASIHISMLHPHSAVSFHNLQPPLGLRQQPNPEPPIPPSIQPNPTPQECLLCRGRREHRRPRCSCSCPACRLASAVLRGPAAPSALRAWRLQSTRRRAASVAEKPKFWAEERARKLQVGSVLGWNAVVEDQGAVWAEDKAAEGIVS